MWFWRVCGFGEFGRFRTWKLVVMGYFRELDQWKDIVIMGMLLSKYRYENVFFFLNLKLFYVLVCTIGVRKNPASIA